MPMMMQLTESQNELIKTVARQNGFTDNFEVDTFPGSVEGDNYLGAITKVTIKNKERKLELILKSASISETFRKAAPRNVYCRELYVYEKIFVEFEKFQNEFNISNPFTGHAKLFERSMEDGQECLVMENMLEAGYKLWNRKIPMDAEHIKAVFIEYAKFHSISLAMAHKKPELFNNLTSDIEKHVFQSNEDFPEMLNFLINSTVATGTRALENEPKLLKVLEKLASDMPEYFLKELANPKWNLVVKHGDSWCNNLMFKYEDSETTRKISNVCILDWQMAQKASPASDLTYFFLAHSPKEVLYDYRNYLKLYHDTVCNNLKEFSCDPEEIFPYSLLEQHWRKFIIFGLNMSLIVLKIMYRDTDDTSISEELSGPFSFNLKNAAEFNQRVIDLMKFLVDTKLV